MAVVATACSSSDASGDDDASRSTTTTTSRPEPQVRVPEEPTTVLPGTTAAELAVATSGALFVTSPVVVLAAEADPAAQTDAAAAAVELGAPLLLTVDAPAPPDDGSTTTSAAPALSDVVADELTRLEPRSVVPFGDAATAWAESLDDAPEIVTPDAATEAAADADEADEADETQGDEAQGDEASDESQGAEAEASGDGQGDEGDESDGNATEGNAQSEAEGGEGHGGGRGAEGVLVVVGKGAAGVAASATARSSGARVVGVEGGDPRADPAAIEALAAEPPDRVVAVGSQFGEAGLFRRRLDVAATGRQLPGGGQVLFPHRRMAALYGHPGAPVLGVLGEQPLEATVARAQQLAGSYRGDPQLTVPAFEIIATVASSSPGPDGNYANEGTVEELRPWVEAAAKAGIYVVLDIQPGRTDFLTQARPFEDLLAQPHVGLALDPEWRLRHDQLHMQQIGSVDAAEVNAVAGWLADLTRKHKLPQKLLLLHQFQTAMITNRHAVDTSHDELAVLIHADGFGTHGQKFATWNRMQADPPPNVWWGWKNFHDEDRPMMTPAQTVAIRPPVYFVSYQ